MLPSSSITLALVSATLLLGACSDKVKDTHPQQLVSKRQALFKQMTKALEPMGLVARERQDYVKSEFQANAEALKELSRQPWVFFRQMATTHPRAPRHRSGSHRPNSRRPRTTTWQASTSSSKSLPVRIYPPSAKQSTRWKKAAKAVTPPSATSVDQVALRALE
jgi:hypothetical protein